MTLDQFEALVLSQKPAETPWEPVTDYSFEARKEIEGDHARLILEAFHPCKVMDYGCGHGHLLRLLKEEQPTWPHHFSGYEPNKDLFYVAREWHDVYLVAPPTITHNWDLVICREVLEHCTALQIRKIVTELCALSSRYVYVTTRFHPNPDSLLDVATSDGLDPTHISMLNQDFLRVLFVLEGFRRRNDLEQKMDHMNKGRVLVYERA
jgi:SAM-dependent methyltransferase